MDTEKLESVGRYRGTIEGHSISIKKCPQAVLQLRATKKYITSPEELQHFGMTEPDWHDWDFNQGIIGYLTLYNSGEEFSPDTENFNAGKFAELVDWQKGDIQAFTDGKAFVGKELEFVVSVSDFNGKLQVSDIGPERGLNPVDSATLASLKSKVKGYAAKRPAAASAPRPTPAAHTAVKATSGTATSVAPIAVAQRSSAPPVSRKTKTKAVEAATASLPPLCTRDEAWESVYATKGKLDDAEATDAFIIGTQKVGGDKLEEDFTTAEWGMVRDRAIESLTAANVVA